MTVTVFDRKLEIENPFKGFSETFWNKMNAWGEKRARSVIRQYWWQLDADTRAYLTEQWKKN